MKIVFEKRWKKFDIGYSFDVVSIYFDFYMGRQSLFYVFKVERKEKTFTYKVPAYYVSPIFPLKMEEKSEKVTKDEGLEERKKA